MFSQRNLQRIRKVRQVMRARLRVCASCEWIFRTAINQGGGCPKCGFCHYSARYVYGDKCYQYEITQKPWLDKKIFKYESGLMREIYDYPRVRMEKKKLRLDGR